MILYIYAAEMYIYMCVYSDNNSRAVGKLGGARHLVAMHAHARRRGRARARSQIIAALLVLAAPDEPEEMAMGHRGRLSPARNLAPARNTQWHHDQSSVITVVRVRVRARTRWPLESILGVNV